MIKNIIISVISSLLLTGILPLETKAETVLEEIQETGLLKVGIRMDAVPFGYIGSDSQLTGVCVDFISVLKEQIKQATNRDIITVKLFQSTLFNRFELVEKELVHIECGPNTIREVDNVTFSQPFFVTGTQLLIKKENEKNINLVSGMENVRIGVLRNSTSEELITKNYPQAQIQTYQGVTGRVRGVEAVIKDEIDAFASDGILLIGETINQGVTLTDYKLIPEKPLSCEYYGMILPQNDSEWENLVNYVIQNTPKERLFKSWFDVLETYILNNQQFCGEVKILEEEKN